MTEEETKPKPVNPAVEKLRTADPNKLQRIDRVDLNQFECIDDHDEQMPDNLAMHAIAKILNGSNYDTDRMIKDIERIVEATDREINTHDHDDVKDSPCIECGHAPECAEDCPSRNPSPYIEEGEE